MIGSTEALTQPIALDLTDARALLAILFQGTPQGALTYNGETLTYNGETLTYNP